MICKLLLVGLSSRTADSFNLTSFINNCVPATSILHTQTTHVTCETRHCLTKIMKDEKARYAVENTIKKANGNSWNKLHENLITNDPRTIWQATLIHIADWSSIYCWRISLSLTLFMALIRVVSCCTIYSLIAHVVMKT